LPPFLLWRDKFNYKESFEYKFPFIPLPDWDTYLDQVRQYSSLQQILNPIKQVVHEFGGSRDGLGTVHIHSGVAQ
jgi:hypothetical protein